MLLKPRQRLLFKTRTHWPVASAILAAAVEAGVAFYAGQHFGVEPEKQTVNHCQRQSNGREGGVIESTSPK